MESETEEVDLVISKFIPLFECNLPEKIDDYKLNEKRDVDPIKHYCNTSDTSVNKDHRNVFGNRIENFNASLKNNPKVDLNWINSTVTSDTECLVNPLDDKLYKGKNVDISKNKGIEKTYNSVERTEQKCRKNVFIEKSQDICLYEYNLPILFDQVVENDRKFTKLFEKYGGRENIYIESNRVMEASVLEECNKDEQNIEFEMKNSSKEYKNPNRKEQNNNTRFSKNYLNDICDNNRCALKNKQEIPSNESLPWTMKLRTRKKYIHTDLNINNGLHNSESEEVLEYEDEEEEWIPGTESERLGINSERQSTDSFSESDVEINSHFNATKRSNNVGKNNSVMQTRISPSSSNPQRSRQNPRSSSTSKGSIYYCHHPGCYMYFNRPSKLTIHERTHTGERPFVCSVKGCERTYIRQMHLKRHMIRSHKPKDTDHTKQCEKCGKSFADIHSMQKHLTNYHVRREYTCEVCNKVFKKHQHLRSHSYLHTGIQPYECQHPGCEMRFINPSKLKRHSRIHESGRYVCSYETNGVVCEEKFDRYHDLRLHISYNHPKECDICGKQFKQKGRLRIHRSTHENVREAFFCPIPECDKFYYQNRNLAAHIRISHEKSYTFECGTCKAILATKQKLSDHMKVHEVGYQRDWSRSKPTKARKDKGVPRTDFTKLLSGYNETDSCTTESELEDMEIEEQKELEEQKVQPKQNASTDLEESNLNCLTMKPRILDYFGGMEYMEIDDKTQSVDISESVDHLEMNTQKSMNSDGYFPSSSEFTLLLANDDENDDKNNTKENLLNKTEYSVLGNNVSNKFTHGGIHKIVQGKTTSVSIKTKLG